MRALHRIVQGDLCVQLEAPRAKAVLLEGGLSIAIMSIGYLSRIKATASNGRMKSWPRVMQSSAMACHVSKILRLSDRIGSFWQRISDARASLTGVQGVLGEHAEPGRPGIRGLDAVHTLLRPSLIQRT